MRILLFTILFVNFYAVAQVGINTTIPNADLEIQTLTSIPSDKGFTVINSNGVSLFTIFNDGSVRINNLIGGGGVLADSTGKLMIGTNNVSIGDVKNGFQSTDHNGWVKLDGRAIASLTSSQQAQAILLGFVTNLPDATNKVLKNKGALGTNGGSNTSVISQENLPNVDFVGATSSNGSHSHNYTVDNFETRYIVNISFFGTPLSYRNSTSTVTTSTTGNHTHSVTVNSGGLALPISVEDSYLSVNTFLYLGN